MKNWTIPVLVILVLAIAFSVYFNIKLNQNLTTLQSNYQTSQKNVSDLQNTMASLKTTVGNLQTTVSTLQSAPTQPASSAIGSVMINLIPQIEPFIARIDVTGAGFRASGSGVVIRQDGYLITNQHVIDSATSIGVTLKDGKMINATVVSSDATLDLAILKLSGTFSNLPAATLGTNQDAVIGSSVIAAGFPVGLDLPGPASFSRGIVSAKRTIDNQDFIQTDATINPGSSGGGLFTLDNKLIGITTSEVVPPGQEIDGLGLAIPVDTVQKYIQNKLK
jgi:serine protease Do